ncbi:MAG: TrkH family potassium uptake protein [candidate division KSB1 bacterium]|nr:TrkH family potassium uptake protein [candidate division KSB1 bacterium]
MRLSSVLFSLGLVLLFMAAAMLFPLAWSVYYQDGSSSGILISFSISAAVGLALVLTNPKPEELAIHESFAIVTLGWLACGLFGCLPFVLTGTLPSFTDAFFETVSGFTTTGASVLNDIESVPKGILFWRSLTHWLGGMGIIVLSLALLPVMGVGGMQLYKAEIPGPVPEKLAPRISQTAKLLWLLYAGLSAAETVALMLAGMDLFDALCHTFGTMATGGFSTHNRSIAYFGPAVQWIIIVFMLLAGSNFALHYRALQGKPSCYWKSEEFRFYLVVIVGSALLLLAMRILDPAWQSHSSLADDLRDVFFQSASITTTTGFVTADFEQWPPAAQFLLLLLMFFGGCAGSTGGSVKMMRVLVLLKQGIAEMRKLLHSRAVVPVRLDGQRVSSDLILNILGFTFLYLLVFSLGTLLMSLMGLDLISAVSSVAATLGNVGPGLGCVGPTDNYAQLPALGKWLLSFLMVLGRLEIYTVLVLFTRDFWRR